MNDKICGFYGECAVMNYAQTKFTYTILKKI